jgi:diguanylate cyclase
MKDKLKEITFKTLKQAQEGEEVILPSQYDKLFRENAKTLEVDLDCEVSMKEFIESEMQNVNRIAEKTAESVRSLEENTQKAKTAIQENNLDLLEIVNKDIVNMQKEMQKLKKELYEDALTKAKNRKWFLEEFLANRTFRSSGILSFIDLNKFKIINDTYGHIIGDRVLKYVVHFLKKEFEKQKVEIIRYAGDEFLVIFKTETLDIANQTMQFLQSKISKRVLNAGEHKIKTGFSFGCVEFNVKDSFDNIIEQADEAMYENKKAIKEAEAKELENAEKLKLEGIV